MEVSGGEEEGFVREWTPCSQMLNLIPPRVQTGLFSSELCLTCIDAVSEYIALGTNIGLVYWYDRKKANIQRLRCENSSSPITFVKIANTVDYMVGAGNAAGQVTVFQIPKEHPENIPDSLKPKVEPKVERYTIGGLHKSMITAIEWSNNGMKVFSGDKNGVIIVTEIDFYMHLCKSSEIVNEEHEIVQLSYKLGVLLVSSLYRSIVCDLSDGKWHVSQIGKKERKSLCRLGGVCQHSASRGGEPTLFLSRSGMRLWQANVSGDVKHTLLYREAITNPLTIVELLNPSQRGHSHTDKEYNFGPLYMFNDKFIVSHNEDILYILDPTSLTAIAVVDHLRRILSVSVNKDEIFILEGPRSVVRLGRNPEPGALRTEKDPVNQMTKSLTSSFQHAMNTVRDFAHLDQTVPFITSVLEQPISLITNSEVIESATVAQENSIDLPPIRNLPSDMSNNVLESIINEFKDVSCENEDRKLKNEELQKKLQMFCNVDRKGDEGLVHYRRGRKKDSGGSTPRMATPVRKVDPEGVSYTSPCIMNLSVYGMMPKETDDVLEREIEEKEKILAKMLNIDSLSIKQPLVQENNDKSNDIFKTQQEHKVEEKPKIIDVSKKKINKPKPEVKCKEQKIGDLVPKLVQLPNNWNLGDIELKLDLPPRLYTGEQMLSPDDTLESEWEFV